MYIFAFIHTNVHVGTFSSCTCGHISQLYPLWRPSSNPVAMSEWVSESHSVMLYSLWPHGLYSPWNSPGQNAGVGSCSLLQGIFPTQGSNPGLQHCRQILYHLSHQGSCLWWFASKRPGSVYLVFQDICFWTSELPSNQFNHHIKRGYHVVN